MLDQAKQNTKHTVRATAGTNCVNYLPVPFSSSVVVEVALPRLRPTDMPNLHVVCGEGIAAMPSQVGQGVEGLKINGVHELAPELQR